MPVPDPFAPTKSIDLSSNFALWPSDDAERQVVTVRRDWIDNPHSGWAKLPFGNTLGGKRW
jgi:hypothetical protein